jgi:hypothetical protein
LQGKTNEVLKVKKNPKLFIFAMYRKHSIYACLLASLSSLPGTSGRCNGD